MREGGIGTCRKELWNNFCWILFVTSACHCIIQIAAFMTILARAARTKCGLWTGKPRGTKFPAFVRHNGDRCRPVCDTVADCECGTMGVVPFRANAPFADAKVTAGGFEKLWGVVDVYSVEVSKWYRYNPPG